MSLQIWLTVRAPRMGALTSAPLTVLSQAESQRFASADAPTSTSARTNEQNAHRNASSLDTPAAPRGPLDLWWRPFGPHSTAWSASIIASRTCSPVAMHKPWNASRTPCTTPSTGNGT